MKKRIAIISAVVVAVLLIGVTAVNWLNSRLEPFALNPQKPVHTVTGTTEEMAASGDADYPILAAENDNFRLLCREDGKFCVVSKATGYRWESNPLETDSKATGINKTNMSSQLYITYANEGGNATTKNSTVECVNKKWLTYAPIEHGVRYTYDFQKAQIVIPVEYVLEEDGVRASIVVDEIVEGGLGFFLTEVSLLPYFSAAIVGGDGYILVPDGSGALLHHDNEKASYGAYRQPVYGRDAALILDKLAVSEETVRMPVFGQKNNDSGYLAVIDSGDGVAYVNAMTSGSITSYNNAYASFRFRPYTMGTFVQGNTYAHDGVGDSQQTLMLPSVQPNNIDFSVKYILLEEEGLDYVDMAEAYRRHMIDSQGLTVRVEENSAPFYVEMLGSIRKEDVVMGLRLNILQELTTFEQAQRILDVLREGGMEELAVKYVGWGKGGIESAIPAKINFEGSLGGQKGYEKLAAYAREKDIDLFLDFDFINLHEGGNGLSSFLDANQTIERTPTYIYNYDYNTLEKNVSERWLLLTPRLSVAALDKMLGSQEALLGAGVSLSTMGETLYSDFTNKATGLDRANARVLWGQALALADEKTDALMVDGGNAYTLPYVSHVYNAPTTCTMYDIEDEAVPFYQIVLHGYVSYATEPLNLSSDPTELILKALETGSSLSACLMYAENHALTDTNYEYVSSGNYETWISTLCDAYQRTDEVLKAVATSPITGHERLGNDVYKTTYANGAVVYVNYGGKDAQAEGCTVPAMDFVYLTGKEAQ